MNKKIKVHYNEVSVILCNTYQLPTLSIWFLRDSNPRPSTFKAGIDNHYTIKPQINLNLIVSTVWKLLCLQQTAQWGAPSA